MKNNKGFTLTEVLLAVMIVGIIGVALAALTTAASREGGVGRTRVLLRNNLSLSLRQLRQDVQDSSRVLYVRGKIDSASAGDVIPLLVLAKGVGLDGFPISDHIPTRYITYCFVVGSTAAAPTGALSGGTIYRRELLNTEPSWDIDDTSVCGTPASDSNFKVFLHNVKFIQPMGSLGNSDYYPVPWFRVFPKDSDATYSVKDDTSKEDRYKNLASVLNVALITELAGSDPVVNDVVEETFVLPNGFQVK